jgi:prephenate dehydrogenase
MGSNYRNLKDMNVAVVGLGIMGGSLAGALKANNVFSSVYGIDTDPKQVKYALENKEIDIEINFEEAALKADVIILATPVKVILEQLGIIEKIRKTPCFVFDLGSTKVEIVKKMEVLPEVVQCAGGHPMCGGNRHPDLYREKVFIISPVNRNSVYAKEVLINIIDAIGARPKEIGAERHDRIVATISHYQHFISILSMQIAETVAKEELDLWEVAAGSFRHMTKLSMLNIPMWRDIFLSNSKNLNWLLDLTEFEIAKWRQLLLSNDTEAMNNLLDDIYQKRKDFDELFPF